MNKREILLLILGILGAIDLAWRGAEIVFPRILSVQSRVWRTIADTIAVRAFRRKAVAVRVEEVLNQSAFNLQKYLPNGWIRRAKVQWVRNPKAPQLREGDIVLRVRPQKQTDHNVMHALTIYFQRALFPESRDLLSHDLLSASALAITRSALEQDHPYLLAEFDNGFVRAAGEGKENALNYFADCVRLNHYGLLMGPFVREVDNAANSSRFTLDRADLPRTIRRIMDHMLAFQPMLRLTNLADEAWWHIGAGTSYGFILVSKPPDMRPGIEAYVRRAQEKVRKGVQRVYIIGRDEEREFVSAVIRGVLNIRELKGLELFPLFRDYRGDPGGVGALIGLDSLLAKLNLSPRDVAIDGSEHFEADRLSPSEVLVVAPTSPRQRNLAERTDADNGGQPDFSVTAKEIISQLSAGSDQWVNLADFGSVLRGRIPGFTPKNYGGQNLTAVLKKLGTVEIGQRQDPQGMTTFVRLKRRQDTKENVEPALSKPKTLESQITKLVRMNGGIDGWLDIATLERLLVVDAPTFRDETELCLSDFIATIPSLETDKRGDRSEHTYVRIRR